MLLNYLKIALRNIKRQKSYVLINIIGLAMGMACCILIMSWVFNEMSYDRYHKNADNLYLMLIVDNYPNNEKVYYSVTPPPLAPALKAEYPEITNTARLKSLGKTLIRYGEKAITDDIVSVADKSVFELFTFDFLQGDAQTAFPNPNSIVITRDMRDKYFGDADPMGKTLTIENKYDFTVTAVIDNLPENTHLRFDCLVPIEIIEKSGGILDSWEYFSYRTYALIPPGHSIEEISRKIEGIYREKSDPETITAAALMPVSRFHLHSGHITMAHTGDIRYVYVFSITALFVLLIACINFINLTTARASSRALEVGIRKTIGARRKELIAQFLIETILLSLTALALASILVEIALPAFNSISGKHFTIGNITSAAGLAGIFGIVLLTGLFSGSYPAFFLSSFRPAAVLKGSPGDSFRGSFFRKILVVGQFTITIALLICTIIAYKQLTFIKNRNLGFNKDHVIDIRVPSGFAGKYDIFKRQLLSNPEVLGVTVCSDMVSRIRTSYVLEDWEGKTSPTPFDIRALYVDEDFCKTFDIELLEGRFFSRDFSDSSTYRVVINEAAAAVMDMNDPVGKRYDTEGEIIGVIKDFHISSLHRKIEPLALYYPPEYMRDIDVRIDSRNIDKTISYIKNSWNNVIPDTPFEYSFLDEEIDRMYTNDRRINDIFKYFTILTLFISCLGLLGLSSFIIEKRKKEIGIRKVFGASIPDVLSLISREFLILVTIANLIAWPVAFIIMSRFLEAYAYRIEIGASAFLLSGALAIIVAGLTISYQVTKSALANPIDSIKYE